MVTFFQGNRGDISAKHAFLQTESSQRREQKVEHVLRVLPLVTMGVQVTYFPEVVNIFPRSGEHISQKWWNKPTTDNVITFTGIKSPEHLST